MGIDNISGVSGSPPPSTGHVTPTASPDAQAGFAGAMGAVMMPSSNLFKGGSDEEDDDSSTGQDNPNNYQSIYSMASSLLASSKANASGTQASTPVEEQKKTAGS